jgi:hypothetical protein
MSPTVYLSGGVLDLDLTDLDRQAEFIAINKQPNDDVVHLDRFRKADRLAHQTLDTCAPDLKHTKPSTSAIRLTC